MLRLANAKITVDGVLTSRTNPNRKYDSLLYPDELFESAESELESLKLDKAERRLFAAKGKLNLIASLSGGGTLGAHHFLH